MKLNTTITKSLWTLLLFLSIGLSTAFSQDFKDKDLEKKTVQLTSSTNSLTEMFRLIQSQTQLNFEYDVQVINGDKQIIVKDKQLSLKSLFNVMRDQTGYRFSQDGNVVKVIPPVINANQPTKTVTGTVTDKEGYKIPSVSLRLKGTTVATITNDSGFFSIKIPTNEKQPTLVFSFVGYESREIIVGNVTTVDVILNDAANLLNEAVVIGYGTVQRKDVTGSVSSVVMKDVEVAPIKSFEEALAGRVAGVQVVSSDGQPGGESNIVIRGTGTLSQGSGPLYVIDGFPQEATSFNNINPQDIESIEVLKDASSTAIYGARGANGVIIITTKKGKAGKPTITYNGYYGQQEALKLMDVMSTYDFIRLQNDINPTFTAKTYFQNGRDLEFYRTAPSINWQKQTLRPATFSNHSISLSGKSGKTNYYISGNYVDQEGLVLKSGFKRYQARMTLEQEVSDKLKINLTANYGATKSFGNIASTQTQAGVSGNGTQNNAQFNLMYGLWSYRPVNGTDNLDALLNNISDDESATLDLDRVNPYLLTINGVNNNYENILSANSFVEYKLLKNLKFKVSGGINLRNRRGEVFNNQYTRAGSPTTAQGINLGQNGSISNYYETGLLNENTLTYDQKFNKKHTINVVAGFSNQANNYSGNSLYAIKVPNPDLGINGLDEGTPYSVGSYSSLNHSASFFGRANYGFDSRYLLTATFRADGSSKFAPGHKWGYFPSGAFAWRFMNEPFMKNYKKVLSDGKFRLSYGLTGNNRVSDFAAFSNITTPFNSRYSFNNNIIVGSAPATIDNPNLTWETSATFDAGLDLSFMEGRFNIEMDYYNKRTYDLLLNASISQTTGFASATQNIGNIENKGLEFSFTTTNIRTKDFSWKTNFNISFNQNRLLGLANNEWARADASTSNTFSADLQNVPLYLARVNYPVAQFYGYLYDGLYQVSDFDKILTGTTTTYILKDGVPYYGGTKTSIQPGDVKFKDLNGDGLLNSGDYTIIGNPYPKHIGGLSNSFTFKGFDLNVFFQWSYGNDVFNGNRVQLEGITTGDNTRSLGINQFAQYADYWTFTNQTAKYPRATPHAGGIRAYSTRVIEDASFLRLKTVSLGYNLPTSILKRIKLGSVRLHVSGQNLFTWTKYSGPDPEVSTKNSPLTPGFDYSPYPRTRVIVGGAVVSF